MCVLLKNGTRGMPSMLSIFLSTNCIAAKQMYCSLQKRYTFTAHLEGELIWQFSISKNLVSMQKMSVDFATGCT